MKNTLTFLMLSVLISSAQTNLPWTVDISTVHSNITTSSGTLWTAGTNQPYTAVNSNGYSIGDTPLVANQKHQSNEVFIAANVASNAASIWTNAAILNPPVITLFTNLYPGSTSNVLGQVNGYLYSTLSQVTNYTPLQVWADNSTSTNFPFNYTSPWFAATNGLPTNVLTFLMLAGPTNGVGTFGQPATVTTVSLWTNGVTRVTNVFSIAHTLPTNYIGGFSNLFSWSLTQHTNYDAVQLWGSFSGTNFSQISVGFTTTNAYWLALVTPTNSYGLSTNFGGFASVTAFSSLYPALTGGTNQFLGVNLEINNLQLDGGQINGQPWPPAGGTNGVGITNISAVVNTSATNTPSVTFTNLGGGSVVGYYNLPLVAAATNAVFPTPVYTLWDTNPLVFSGSNYIGHFTNVYSFKLLTPIVGGGGGLTPIAGSNEVENVWASYDNTNFFFVSNNPCSYWTNVYISVVGSSGTNAGELVLYSMLNYQYSGVTYDLSGNIVKVSDNAASNNAVNYETVQSMIASANYNKLSSTATGLAYAPYGSNVLTISGFTVTLPPSNSIAFTSLGTNWVLSIATTNQPTAAQLQASTNLTLPGAGFFVFSGATISTNAGRISYTIPKYICSQSYEFFQLAAIAQAGMNVTPPLTLQNGLIFVTNTVTSATNSTLGYGAGLVTCDTNYLYVSVATNTWRRISIPTNTW